MASKLRTGGFGGDYIPWTVSRINATLTKYDKEYFDGKTVLDVGAGWGGNGNEFSKFGSIVTVSDAREEHMRDAKERYPHLNCVVVDSESTEWDYTTDVFDVIVHWGLLYHLQNPEEHIKLLSNHCKELILETEVSDSDDVNLIEYRNEETDWDSGAWGMAYSGVGCLPSYAWVERVLSENGFEWERLDNPSIANARYHHYDWKRNNSGNWKSGQRAFWFCKNMNKWEE